MENLKVLKQKQQEAVRQSKGSFKFEGHLLDTQYAKYLIEHAENVFGLKKNNSQ